MNKDYLYFRGLYRDELYHYGIKGQKKGQRRFQNEDGSLTPEGEERYRKKPSSDSRKSQSSVTSETLQKVGKPIHTVNKGLRTFGESEQTLSSTSRDIFDISRNIKTKPGSYTKKDYSQLSDKELKDRVKRLSLEEQYGKLTGDTKYIKSGSEKARELLQTIGSTIAIGASAASIVYTYFSIADKVKNKGK